MLNQDDVIAADDIRYTAMIAGDGEALLRLLSDNLVYIHSSGRRDTRASLLARLQQGELHYRDVRRGATEVHGTADLALLRGEIEIAFEMAGMLHATNLAYIAVWERLDAMPRLLHWQSTRLLPPA